MIEPEVKSTLDKRTSEIALSMLLPISIFGRGLKDASSAEKDAAATEIVRLFEAMLGDMGYEIVQKVKADNA